MPPGDWLQFGACHVLPEAMYSACAYMHRQYSIPKGASARWAMHLLSVKVRRGNAEMYRRSGLVIPRDQGLRSDAGFVVPVLI